MIYKFFLMWLIAFVSCWTQAETTATEAPAAIVERLQNEILAIDRRFSAEAGNAATFSARVAAMKPLIEGTHDLAAMSRLTLKSRWSSLDKEQRLMFVRSFAELSVTSYAARFRDLAGVGFRISDARQMPRGRVEVQTQLIEAEGSIVALNYLLHDTGAGWKIINVLADGVSELALKRSQYRSILDKQDFPALLQYLEQQTDALRQEAIGAEST